MSVGRRIEEVRMAIMLLSRIRVWPQWPEVDPPNPRDIIWALPLAGAAIGGLGALAYVLLVGLANVPESMAAIATLALMLLATGALHEDGLADTADGFGGGRTRERKLDIMRDSRIGTYGALSLMLSLAWRGAAISLIADPGLVAGALVACGALSRGAVVLMLARLPPARSDGLGVAFREIEIAQIGWGLATASLIAVAVLPVSAAVLLALAGVTTTLWFASVARGQIGGYTGDTLGAVQQLSECAMLLALVALISG